MSADSINVAAIIREMEKLDDVFEVYHKTEFRCYRNGKSGPVQEVTVTILDAGTDAPADGRYHCVAQAKGGKTIRGKYSDSVEFALADLPWKELD